MPTTDGKRKSLAPSTNNLEQHQTSFLQLRTRSAGGKQNLKRLLFQISDSDSDSQTFFLHGSAYPCRVPISMSCLVKE